MSAVTARGRLGGGAGGFPEGSADGRAHCSDWAGAAPAPNRGSRSAACMRFRHVPNYRGPAPTAASASRGGGIDPRSRSRSSRRSRPASSTWARVPKLGGSSSMTPMRPWTGRGLVGRVLLQSQKPSAPTRAAPTSRSPSCSVSRIATVPEQGNVRKASRKVLTYVGTCGLRPTSHRARNTSSLGARHSVAAGLSSLLAGGCRMAASSRVLCACPRSRLVVRVCGRSRFLRLRLRIPDHPLSSSKGREGGQEPRER